jgi:hypothetical protein
MNEVGLTRDSQKKFFHKEPGSWMQMSAFAFGVQNSGGQTGLQSECTDLLLRK